MSSMEYLFQLVVELAAELVSLAIVSICLLYQKRVANKKLDKLKEELSLEKLNNSESDDVLLIHNMDYLTTDKGMENFNRASIVLLKDESTLYNTVVKNKYGDSGVIGSTSLTNY